MRDNATNERVSCANAFWRERTPGDDFRRLLSPLFFLVSVLLKVNTYSFLTFLTSAPFCQSCSWFHSSFVVCQSSYIRRRQIVESARVLLFPYFSRSRIAIKLYCIVLYWWVHFPRSATILFCFICLDQFPALAIFCCCCSNCLNYLSCLFFFFFFLQISPQMNENNATADKIWLN